MALTLDEKTQLKEALRAAIDKGYKSLLISEKSLSAYVYDILPFVEKTVQSHKEEYGRDCWDRACEAMQQSIVNHYGANPGAGIISLTHAPKPDFQP